MLHVARHPTLGHLHWDHSSIHSSICFTHLLPDIKITLPIDMNKDTIKKFFPLALVLVPTYFALAFVLTFHFLRESYVRTKFRIVIRIFYNSFTHDQCLVLSGCFIFVRVF